jgi:hypothetical protein
MYLLKAGFSVFATLKGALYSRGGSTSDMT